MAAQALYRKWRPQTYEEISGQEHVTRTLRNALRAGRIAHAYLFAGPRGTGKTSMARILAKSVNCLSEEAVRPCNECAMCRALNEGRLLDLIEIDAASNRGIDEVRDLREKIGFVPNEARYKVYILDEAHMLTNPAFNALLKTLEEPPAHVIFVLVTTEAQSVPVTIRSRCQRFDFRRLRRSEIVARLEHVLREEGLDAERAALDAIAANATGSMRDAISLLDQLRSYGHETISLSQVDAVLGGVGDQSVQELVGHLASGEVPAGLALLNHSLAHGVETRQLLDKMLRYLRQVLLVKVGAGEVPLDLPDETLAALSEHAKVFSREHLLGAVHLFNQALGELRGGAASQLPLELAFIEAASAAVRPTATGAGRSSERSAPAAPMPSPAGGRVAAQQLEPSVPSPGRNTDVSAAPASVATPVRSEAAPRPRPRAAEVIAEAAVVMSSSSIEDAGSQPRVESSEALVELQARWDDVLAEVRGKSFKAEAALRSSCQPVTVAAGLVTVAFRHEFHKDMIEDPEHQSAVEQAISSALGEPHKMRCVLMSDLPAENPAPRGRRKARSKERAREGAESPSAAVSSTKAAPPIQEAPDPVVQEAIESYGAKVVKVT